jgi:hypothetical protein
MFNAVKHPPKWAIIAGGGAAAAGLIYMKTHKTSAPADPSAGDGSGAIGYTDAQNMPGIVVAPSQPIASTGDDGSGALGSLYLGALGDLFAGLESQNSQLLGAVLGTGGGGASIGSTGSVAGVVAQPSPDVTPPPPPPPPPAPAPAPPPPPPNPCAGMEAGGSAGACHPAGAICRQMLKCDTNSNGHYCVWKFKFGDGHANCYSNYSSGAKAGQCVGPYGCP